MGLCPGCFKHTQPDITLAPHSPSQSPSPPSFPSHFKGLHYQKEKSLNFFPIWLFLPTSVLLPSPSHYKHLSRPWEEAGKPIWVKAKKGGETINLINSSPRFPTRSHQYETEKRRVWCDMRSGDDGRATLPPLLAATPACAAVRLWCWTPAFIYVSDSSKS